MLAHNLTTQQIAAARSLANEGRTAEAWQYLSFHGDSYADNAAAVTGLPKAGAFGEQMNVLVREHWDLTAGRGAYEAKFETVAREHLSNYLNIISQGPNFPTSEQIEQSYRDAVINNGLPVKTAIDGVITQSILSYLVDWPFLLRLENERVVPSTVFDDITMLEASASLYMTGHMTLLALM
ncbi:MAG: hypothetical protein KF908_10955, partial [Nitrosomonas sp.]|nr:hypothetical protein [Nitrosomonas sp.]